MQQELDKLFGPLPRSAVVDHLEARLLDPARLEALMDQILERRDEWMNQRREHVADLERRAAEAEAKLKRLYDAIKNGVIDVNDPSLKDRIAELAATRDQAKGDAERALAHIVKIGPAITPDSLRVFAAPCARSCATATERSPAIRFARSRNAWKW